MNNLHIHRGPDEPHLMYATNSARVNITDLLKSHPTMVSAYVTRAKDGTYVSGEFKDVSGKWVSRP